MAEFDQNQIRRLDGSLLLVFRELLRRRRGTEVAQQLGLSPSAISHALTRLRDIFGDPLFIRRPHGLEPTRRALELGPRIEALIELVSTTLGTNATFNPERTERWFGLAAPEFVTITLGAGLLHRMRAMAPRAAFGFQHYVEDQALDALRRHEVDIAVGRFTSLRSGMAAVDLYEEQYCVVARRGHPHIDGRISLDTYARNGHVFAMAGAEGMPDESDPGHPPVTAIALVPRWLSALSLVAASDAIATCPLRFAESQAAIMNLQVIEAPFPRRPFMISAVRRVEGEDRGVDWFIDQMKAHSSTSSAGR
jgi:DNA-binding transcriptional LysR family regulator